MKIVPQALSKTLSHPILLPGQDSELIKPHLLSVIEPVSITPIVARMPINVLATLDPGSCLLRVLRRDGTASLFVDHSILTVLMQEVFLVYFE